MKDPIAIVAPAENPANAASTLRKLVGAVEKADAAVKVADGAATKAREVAAAARLAAGRQLIEDRKRWPMGGPKAKGWGEHLRAAELAERTAREWMALAGYVEKELGATRSSGAELPSVVTYPTIPPRREVAREQRRVIVDHSQDAAGGGDEPAWQEPTYTPDGEEPAPATKPCKLCGTVPGGKPTKLASTCKNGCGHSATRTGAATPAPATPQALPVVAVPPRQLAFDWTATAEAVRRDCGAAGVEAAADLVDDMCSRVPGLAEALRVRLAAG